jgi:hypothetical protein
VQSSTNGENNERLCAHGASVADSRRLVSSRCVSARCSRQKRALVSNIRGAGRVRVMPRKLPWECLADFLLEADD